MPHSIALREIAVHVNQPGFRTASLVVVTTLRDAEAVLRDEIAELYHRRWRVEYCQPYCLLCENFDEGSGRGVGVLRSAA